MARLLCFGLVLLSATAARSQEEFRAWVGLYDPAQLGWLENENRLGELCPDSSTLADCYAAQLAPLVSVYTLHAAADSISRRVGELIVAATPGRGLSAHYRAAGSREAAAFTPDLHLQDWGYGPYFHQTVSARSGNWFELPVGPWKETVWIHRESETRRPSTISLQAGDIIELKGSSWYVMEVEPDALVLRPEQAADLWCEEREPPALEPFEPTRIARRDLVDANGHLLMRLKYMKGC